MTRPHRRLRRIGSLAVMALLATACNGGAGDTTTAPSGAETTVGANTTTTGGGELPGLVVGCTDTVPTWDGLAAFNNECGYNGIPLLFDPIAYPTSDLSSTEPIGAASISHNDDFSVWTVTLRPGMTFHNGDPVTSEDLKFTLDRVANSIQWSYTLGGFAPDLITAVDIVDDLTVTITPPTPNAEIEALGLSSVAASILPKDFGGMSEEEFWANPYGSGPYTLTSWTPGEEATLTRYDAYHTPEWQTSETIQLLAIPDDNARILGLESGDLDIGLKLPTNADTIVASSDVTVVTRDPSAVSELMVITNAPPFDDSELRKAVYFALNRADLLAGAWDGKGRLPQGVIPSALPFAAPGAITPTQDLAAAQAALEASAYAGGTEFELMVVEGDTNRETAAQIIQADLADLGITVNIAPLGFAEVFDRLTTGQFQSALYGYEAVVAPASDIVGFFAATAGFFGGWDTTDALNQFLTAQATADPAGKSAAFSAFETNMAENAYTIPLAERSWLAGYGSAVSDLDLFPTNFAWLNRVAH